MARFLVQLPRDGIDQKTDQFFFWSFFKQNGTKLEAKLHFFRISSLGLEFWESGVSFEIGGGHTQNSSTTREGVVVYGRKNSSPIIMLLLLIWVARCHRMSSNSTPEILPLQRRGSVAVALLAKIHWAGTLRHLRRNCTSLILAAL